MAVNIERMRDKISLALDAAEDASREADDAKSYLDQVIEMVDNLATEQQVKSFTAECFAASVSEAVRYGLPALIAKYGHSSEEVRAAEHFIAE